jgi:hypothetical protein
LFSAYTIIESGYVLLASGCLHILQAAANQELKGHSKIALLLSTGILDVAHERTYLTHGMARIYLRIPKWVLEKLPVKICTVNELPVRSDASITFSHAYGHLN